MKIQSVTDKAFRAYGKVINDFDYTRLLKEMKHTVLPEDVTYVPSVKRFEELEVAAEFRNRIYGGLPIQVGYCNGHNDKLNAVEYHRSSEVDIAVEDLILLVGKQQDIQSDFTYDTSLIEAFLVPAGTAVELFATTLHYAPCGVDKKGFRCAVILPKDTNTEIDFPVDRNGEGRLITAKNKWLIAHEDAKIEGAFEGLKGINISVVD